MNISPQKDDGIGSLSMSQADFVTNSETTGKDILVGFCGLMTSLITAVIIWGVELGCGFVFYGWTICYIVPAGAILSGLVGTIGYYAGARFFNHRPTPLLLLNMLIGSVGTFFAVYYLSYITLEFGGKAVKDYFSFGQFMDIAIRSISLLYNFNSTQFKTTGELGGWGYGVAILEILGFAIGSLVLYFVLVSIPYCHKCSRYFTKKWKHIRYTGNTEDLMAISAQIHSDFSNGDLTKVIEKNREFGNQIPQKGNHLRTVLEVQHCKRCGQHWMKYSAEILCDNDKWKEISNLTAKGYTDHTLVLGYSR